jgi:dinuclear metal center YbgI/SA1388 family protein
MASLSKITAYSNELLRIDAFSDYCPNGLQVEGGPEIERIVTGVTASQGLIDAAIDHDADLLLVHHGYFWKGEDPCITGMKHRRIAALMRHDIALLAYHLPLDAHPELGNNAQLARILGFEIEGPLNPDSLVWLGRLDAPRDLEDLGRHIGLSLDRPPELISGGDHKIERLGWCTGAAQSYLEQAASAGVDAFISGEISEQTVHIARELGIHYIAAGHHATERYGVQSLGEKLAREFGLSHHFIDIPNPV